MSEHAHARSLATGNECPRVVEASSSPLRSNFGGCLVRKESQYDASIADDIAIDPHEPEMFSLRNIDDQFLPVDRNGFSIDPERHCSLGNIAQVDRGLAGP
jgi:hypothetical protein